VACLILYAFNREYSLVSLFGTDGIRGVANDLLTGEFAFRIALTIAELLRSDGKKGQIYIGKDSRMSSDMLEHAMASGFMSRGYDVVSVGIIPTAGLAHTTSRNDGILGVMISASHNQVIDNGIKFFNDKGMKLDQDEESRIESGFNDKLIENLDLSPTELGSFITRENIHSDYVDYLRKIPQSSFSGMKIILDTAHGAACGYAGEVFKGLGADIEILHDCFDGRKINVDCGSNYPAIAQKRVKESDAVMGVAFDGDADRAILIDENGELVNGDQVLAMWGSYLLKRKALRHETIVGTVLSNQGLEIFLKGKGGHLIRTDVGDKYIMREMARSNYQIGGEQSGHIIFFDHFVTGDGITTALKVADLMKLTGEPLSKLANLFTPYPQVALNVPTTDRTSWASEDSLKKLLDELGSEVSAKANGRILVRASGTQPLIRIMVEAEDADVAQSVAERARDSFREYLEKNGTLLTASRKN
jgi:phosphoglucosamine mutase